MASEVLSDVGVDFEAEGVLFGTEPKISPKEPVSAAGILD
ncbi:hypothetical protein BTHERMOSOX_46 [Bathymodiolus thermophilus thioautotrophic gill symbiont]|nr:hypothetical protein BTHERMOSOX_46 [Bathymodiolus thermophilus thioautotrophic gill symbiont]